MYIYTRTGIFMHTNGLTHTASVLRLSCIHYNTNIQNTCSRSRTGQSVVQTPTR